MPIVIYLRRRAALNQFRDIIIRSLRSGLGTEATLCSGFFQERPGYQASMEPGLISGVRTLRRLTTYGVYNGIWIGDYKAFVTSLRSARATVDARRIKGLRWHAKVFILRNNSGPFLGVIGSSNITRAAFSTSAPSNWECDVVLWDSRPGVLSDRIREIALGEDSQPDDYMVADYDAEKNSGLTIADRLKRIQDDLDKLPHEPLE